MDSTATLPNVAITGGTITGLSAPIPITSGGTGATTQSAALTGLLGSSLIPIANGGTNCASASGTCLDNITGFAGTGFVSRTGAGAYSFTASTGSGSVVLATSPTFTWSPATSIQGLTPTATVNRTATYTGGSYGQLNSALNVNLTTGANTTDFEWGIYSLVQNNSLITATPSQSPQNVAVAGYIDKGVFGNTNIGPSWGANFACSDVSAEPNPKASCIGAEMDVFANPNGALTDNFQQRAALQINTGSVSGVHIGSGILFTPGQGSIIDAALRFDGTSSNGTYQNIIDAVGDTPTYTNLITAHSYNVSYAGVVQSTQQTIAQNAANVGLIETYTAGNATGLQTKVGSNLRWNVLPGDGSTESGSNAGSNFALQSFADNGTFIATPLTIARATGAAAFSSSVSHAQQEIDASYTYNTPTTGQTVTLATGTETAIIAPAGTLATLTITLPGCTAGYDGSIARFSSSQSITALTVNATSGTVVDAPTTLAIGGGAGYLCRGASTSWYRLY